MDPDVAGRVGVVHDQGESLRAAGWLRPGEGGGDILIIAGVLLRDGLPLGEALAGEGEVTGGLFGGGWGFRLAERRFGGRGRLRGAGCEEDQEKGKEQEFFHEEALYKYLSLVY
jgi:hypothetical protein